MASKYAHLKGRIPTVPSIRDQALETAVAERTAKTVAELTAEFNEADAEAKDMAAKAKVLKVKADALEILIRRKLDAEDADAIRINGYTWSETFEPYPIVDMPEDIEGYFQKHDPDQLRLSKSELADRCKKVVREEAAANELSVETKQIEDPTAPGGTREVTEVRSSRIPGVRVYLKPGLSRVKSKGAKA